MILSLEPMIHYFQFTQGQKHFYWEGLIDFKEQEWFGGNGGEYESQRSGIMPLLGKIEMCAQIKKVFVFFGGLKKMILKSIYFYEFPRLFSSNVGVNGIGGQSPKYQCSVPNMDTMTCRGEEGRERERISP